MRLIDADALSTEMYRKSFEVDDGRNVWNSGLWIRYQIFEEAIKDAPTIDAVPVVRCKDCKWWRPNETCIEWYDSPYEAPADGYCFRRAERKEEC